MRIFILIIAAMIVAAGSGLYLLQGMQAPTPVAVAPVPVEAPKPVQVFVPAAPLAAGTILGPANLSRMALAASSVTEEMIAADEAGEAALLGSVSRQALPKGVPIARSAIVQPGERGFLAAVLPQGKRAISISIGEVAGLSGLVVPGDRVDIILTYSIPADIIDSGRDVRASETVMTNLRVLALDQRLQTAAEQGASAQGSQPMPIARTATLEVTPREAEMITLATTLGDLSLVLNSVRDGGDAAETVNQNETETDLRATYVASALRQAFAPRQMTLDSDVTSLLRRQMSGLAEPMPERKANVLLVRGAVSSAIELRSEDQTLNGVTRSWSVQTAPGAAPSQATTPMLGIVPAQTVTPVQTD